MPKVRGFDGIHTPRWVFGCNIIIVHRLDRSRLSGTCSRLTRKRRWTTGASSSNEPWTTSAPGIRTHSQPSSKRLKSWTGLEIRYNKDASFPPVVVFKPRRMLTSRFLSRFASTFDSFQLVALVSSDSTYEVLFLCSWCYKFQVPVLNSAWCSLRWCLLCLCFDTLVSSAILNVWSHLCTISKCPGFHTVSTGFVLLIRQSIREAVWQFLQISMTASSNLIAQVFYL